MPSIRKRARRHALTFSRSLVKIIRFPCSLFSKPSQPSRDYPYTHQPPPAPPHSNDISRPRQLRRTLQDADRYLQRHFIHLLPVEILGHIFVVGANADPTFPIVVSHVCRAWRYITLRTPSLWRQITLTPKEHMWRERIRRARACSLDIRLLPWTMTRKGVRRPQELTPYTVQWYMHIVLPYIHRWRSLEIVLSEHSPYIWRATLAGFSPPASMLQELSLIYRRNDDTTEFTLFSGCAPCLRRLTVDGIRLNWLPSLFANLTYLNYVHHGFTSGHQTVYDVISILKVSSQLAELHLMFPRGQIARLPPRQQSVNTQVTLPSLTRLQLSVDGSDIPFELAHLVTLVVTPVLSSLRLIDLGRSRHSFANLKSFFYVYAMPPSLRFIHISHGWYDPKMIQPMASSLPQLLKIAIKQSHVPEQVLNVNGRARNHLLGSARRSFGNSSHRHYRIDHLNVQYFPLAFKERCS